MKKNEIKKILKGSKKIKSVAICSALIGVTVLTATAGVGCSKNDMVNRDKDTAEASEQAQEEAQKKSENDIVDGKNHTYKAEKDAVSPAEVRAMLDGTYEGPLEEEKVVFLTFDDGPSKNTEKVLDILEEKDVQGTFFVLGENIPKNKGNKKIIKRIVEDGNSIGNHSYGHLFKNLYPNGTINIENFMADYKKAEDELKSILGDNFKNNVIRMPGGENTRIYYKDKNLNPLLERLESEGISSIDWNALNGDAEGKPFSKEEMMDYVKETSAEKDHIVILMHDSDPKEKTVEVLPEIIEYYKSEGYQFKIIG